jgi:hypothetical protein
MQRFMSLASIAALAAAGDPDYSLPASYRAN